MEKEIKQYYEIQKNITELKKELNEIEKEIIDYMSENNISEIPFKEGEITLLEKKNLKTKIKKIK